MIEVAHGNLLEANAEALINTVNTDGFMGKGIALQFKRAFPANFKAYEKEANAGRMQVGRVFVFELGSLLKPRYIINFPTKQHWRAPSRLEWIREGLDSLVAEVVRRRIRSLAVPPLGCGNGGLEWGEVLPLIKNALGALQDAHVFVYPPEGSPSPERMRVGTVRPRLTDGRAALIALMRRYMDAGFEESVTLLEVHKLMYFLQAAGQPLGLKYDANLYGPFASNLRHVLSHIEGHYLRGFGDGHEAPETELTFIGEAAREAESVLRWNGATMERFDRVVELINGFETPFGMELLATVHWVATRKEDNARSAEAATEAIQRWSPRKAALMKPSVVRAAWERLSRLGWIESAPG